MKRKKLNEMLVDDTLWSDLGVKYSPELVDPVKVLFRKDFSLRAFLKVWGRHLVLHPDTYLSATFFWNVLVSSTHVGQALGRDLCMTVSSG